MTGKAYRASRGISSSSFGPSLTIDGSSYRGGMRKDDSTTRKRIRESERSRRRSPRSRLSRILFLLSSNYTGSTSEAQPSINGALLREQRNGISTRWAGRSDGGIGALSFAGESTATRTWTCGSLREWRSFGFS